MGVSRKDIYFSQDERIYIWDDFSYTETFISFFIWATLKERNLLPGSIPPFSSVIFSTIKINGYFRITEDNFY